jgi:hypothetical protein
MNDKYFTLSESNKMLPALDAQLKTLQGVKTELEEKYRMYAVYKDKIVRRANEQSEGNEKDPLFGLELDMEFLQIQARSMLSQFEQLGVQLKSVELGLIDFPSQLDGQEILLCWRQGETEITHYHGSHEGFAGRKPLP